MIFFEFQQIEKKIVRIFEEKTLVIETKETINLLWIQIRANSTQLKVMDRNEKMISSSLGSLRKLVIFNLEIIMNRIIYYFSVINKICQRDQLKIGANFPRATTDSIPHTIVMPKQIGLSPFQNYLLQTKAMERPFTGNLWHELSTGFYHCVVCDTRLFTFNHKYQSHTGHATFWGAIGGTVSTVDENVKFDEVNQMRVKHKTNTSTYKRCFCSKCKSHLGAVFMDGPPPTFLRYTINSALLKFYDMPDFPDPHTIRQQRRNQHKKKKITYLK